jgi:hypothetical protein
MSSPTPVVPHPILTRIVGKPDPRSLNILEREMYTNCTCATARSIGDNRYGVLALIMSDADYAALPIPPPPFVPPVHPGAHPGQIPNATVHQITEANRAHLAAAARAESYNSLVTFLLQLLLAAVEPLFFAQLMHRITGFANVTLLGAMTHLRTTYGVITGAMLEDNLTELHKEFVPCVTMESLWQRVNDCQAFVVEIDPISELAAVQAMLKVLKKTGVYPKSLADWTKEHPDPATWTMLLFRPFFNLANDARLTAMTTGAAGYSANAAGAPPPAAGVAPGHVLTGTTRMYYCWSHGLGINENHTSATCSNQKPGHQVTATAAKMMGGCNTIFTPRARGAPGAGRPPAGG